MTSSISNALFWFRQDLRISDNPGLYHAAKYGRVLPVYILDEEAAGAFKMGSASKWWLHHSLATLNNKLDHKLNIYQGNAKDILLHLATQHSIKEVYWNRCYEPWHIKNEAEIEASLRDIGVTCRSFNSSLLWEPWDVCKHDGSPYKVFTAFYRKGCQQAIAPRQLLPNPEHLDLIEDKTSRTSLCDLRLLPTIPWYKAMTSCWNIGEDGARQQLQHFLVQGFTGYKEGRNFPHRDQVSRLSPHLHFGEISPHQVWHSVQCHAAINGAEKDLDAFAAELGWREFSYYLLYHFPHIPKRGLQTKFDAFPWRSNADFMNAWQRGQTGYPIIDAGMRELWQTGYMHNRIRMIVSSFLVKNLLIHWHEGAAWFWDCLVDADLANNSASWQWISGCGVDAAPYFRIFNPITQGEKFDIDGNYTRRYVPELKLLPNDYLFKPWRAPTNILTNADVTLGVTYPYPIVDLATSRNAAIEAFASISGKLS